jgi:hypothetical protein
MQQYQRITASGERRDAERSAARHDARAAAVLALQRAAGNHAVAGMLARFVDKKGKRVDFGNLDELTPEQLRDIDARMQKGELLTDYSHPGDLEVERLMWRASRLGEKEIAARMARLYHQRRPY